MRRGYHKVVTIVVSDIEAGIFFFHDTVAYVSTSCVKYSCLEKKGVFFYQRG